MQSVQIRGAKPNAFSMTELGGHYDNMPPVLKGSPKDEALLVCRDGFHASSFY